MRKWKLLGSVLIAGAAVVLVVALSADAFGQEVTDGAPQTMPGEALGAARATEVVTSAISYQGVLEEGGEPVTGHRQMVFRLYADGACSVGVGSSVARTVSVSDGLFNVNLDFEQATFDGQALWLETEVEGTLIGCQPIQTVPYANSLRPGAVVSSSVSAEEDLLHVRSGVDNPEEGILGAKLGRRTGLGYPVGLYAYAYEYGSVGVWGVSDSQFGWGVNGVAEGWDSIGVRGIANAFTSTTYGVYGEAASPSGYGGYFEHTASSGGGVGLVAQGPTGAIITGTDGAGLSVNASGSAGGDDALRGEHSTGDGVVGFSDGASDLDNGVIGFTDGGYGVYGFSNAAGQYAGYFDGPIFAGGGCTGCTLSFVTRNTSDSLLQVGDSVSANGVEAKLAGTQQPVMQVAPSGTADRVLGVVLGRTEVTMVKPGADDAKPGAHYGPVSGPAEPGDYLVVVVQGMAQVRLDQTAEIQSGDLIQAGGDGAIEAVDAPSFGMALEEVNSEGLAWALVGFD